MNFLIIDEMHSSLIPLLNSIGIKGDYKPNIKKEDVAQKLAGYDGVVVRSKVFVNKELLKYADNLKYICRAGAGIDNLDVDYIESRAIKIVNAPEGNRNALAEHTVGLLFSLLNNIVKSDKEVKAMLWDREGNRGHEILGKTIGLIGYGFMGEAFASKIVHFGCRVIVYDKYKNGISCEGIEQVELSEIFEEADVLSVHVPLTEETRFMIDDEFLSKFKKPIWFINTSRGEVASLEAIIHHLSSKRMLGAALDVIENEKLNTFTENQKITFDKLSSFDNVILTPHVAGWSYESYQRINEVLVDKLKTEISA
ncbi:NAD(P)-dependent oxidoreductase [Fulvivirga sp.]|uniref:NAD(P)-dependent oxidoreductase n=1 Tax=Fulvivirga sp. TaxID=1931237 RepID=UPI0032EF00F2